MKRRPFATALVFPCLAFLLMGAGLADSGKTVFLGKSCETCHSVSTAGIQVKIPAMKGGDLVNLAKKYDADTLKRFLRHEIKLKDLDHKREFKGSNEEMEALVTWLLEQHTK